MINPGQAATLAFSATNADVCTGSSRPRDPNFVVRKSSGAVVVRPARTTTYTIKCKKGAASTSHRAVVTVTPERIILSEIFDGAVPHAPDARIEDGELLAHGWKSVYHGYGSNSVARLFDGQALAIRPKESNSGNETHAGLISGPHPSWPVDVKGDLTIEASLHTEEQLRRQNAPNPWEVGWLLWDYVDKTHFYYFIPKPNGWELGKADPAYPGDQRFLASGNRPIYPIRNRYVVKIVQAVTPTSTTISAFVDGVLLTTFTDRERPYSNGLVGFYSEDAAAYFHSVVVTIPRSEAALK
ncbi:putative lipoprotein [Methylocystis sp. SC2]|nr:putative lipoprotein [Methylocystis sp. SC2]